MTAADVVLSALVSTCLIGLAVLIIRNPSNLGDRGTAGPRVTLATLALAGLFSAVSVVGIATTAPNAHAAGSSYEEGTR